MCLPMGGSYVCTVGPVIVDAPTHDSPRGDAPRDAPVPRDAPLDSAFAPWTLVQTTSVESQPALTVQSTGAGNLIVVAIQGTATVASVQDDAANLYVEVPNGKATAGGLGIDLWYAKNSKAGATSIAVASSGTGAGAIVAWEVAGIRTTTPLDTSAALSDQAATTLPLGASVTTTKPGDFIVSAAVVANSISGIHQGNEFTNDSTAKANGWAHITSTAAPAGAHQAKWDQPMSGVYCATSAAFFTGP